MLEAENLEVSYGALAALHGGESQVQSGEMVALVGLTAPANRHC